MSMIEGRTIRWITPQRPRRPLASSGRLSRRLQGAASAVWSLVEVILASRKLSGLIVAAVTLGVAAVCVRDGGIDGLIVNLPALAVIWGAAFELIRLGRGWRGVRPASPASIRRVSPAVRWQGAKATEGR
jgi:hypothetical protein